MSKITEVTRQALELPVDEQLEVAQALWENASPPSAIAPSPELAKLLEERRAEALKSPEAGFSWSEVKAGILEEL